MTKLIKRKLIHAKSAKKYYKKYKQVILEKAGVKRKSNTEKYNAKQREYYYNKHEENKEKNRIAMRRFRTRHKGIEGKTKERKKKTIVKPQVKFIVKSQLLQEKFFYDDGVELTED